MNLEDLVRARRLLPPRAWDFIYRNARRVPQLRRLMDREVEGVLEELGESLRPYTGSVPVFTAIPEEGRPRDEVLGHMHELAAREKTAWAHGRVSGAVYQPDDGHADFLARVYASNIHVNPLHADVWPSGSKFEAEIVAMTAAMLGAAHADGDKPAEERVCGVVTSGGTESIFLAVKAYRDHARRTRGIKKPEMVLPTTAHAAFDKAAECLGVTPVRIPVDATYRAEVRELRRAIGRNTVLVVGSAPSFPHGTIDPIHEMSEVARARGVGFHTDACLGGFLLPWAEQLGYAVPRFDFRLRGVTSMSADTHKYGFAAKGTSVLLYRGQALRHAQYFVSTEWPGGIYFSPTLAGSRPGALVATCWAAMVTTGATGYREQARKILAAAARLKQEIASVPGLRVLGDPLWVIAFASEEYDVYQVMELMKQRGWTLNGLQKPAAVHVCVTPRHAEAGVTERFIADLRWAAGEARRNPEKKTGVAPAYGLAEGLPMRGAVRDLLARYIDRLYEP